MANNDDVVLREFTRVRLEPGAKLIEVGVVGWDGPHTPVLTWVETTRFSETASVEEIELARRKLLQRRKFFVVCKECGRRIPKGHTMDGMCHDCMQKRGAVF